jgi:hypothetical protein
VRDLIRRLAAAIVALGLVALVAGDLSSARFRTWWDQHSLTCSIVSNLLVLAVAGLIVDEVVARRQRRERSVSVAVQGLIVFGQARRAYQAIMAGDADDRDSGGVADELRTLAAMVLTASSSLFDDPEARRLLEQVERFSVSMLSAVSPKTKAKSGEDPRRALASELALLQDTVAPLLGRLPAQDQPLLEGLTAN